MASAKKKPTPAGNTPKTGANVGFEATLWQAADKLRNNMDVAEHEHVVLGLIFLNCIADDERADNIFWVPKAARCSFVEADLVDCMVAPPGQLFYSTQLPACLWFLGRDKRNGGAVHA